jgi:hypothetical protein
MSCAADLPETDFIVCGGDRYKAIAFESTHYSGGNRFTFTGPVADVVSMLSRFDVFGYPLRADHSGSGEQVLIDAMAAGVPAVVFDNGPERFIIDHNKTGLVVSSEREYCEALEILYRNQELRIRLGRAARSAAEERYSIEVLLGGWNILFDDLIQETKKEHHWTGATPCFGAQLYLESLGCAAEPFTSSITATIEQQRREAEEAIARLEGPFRTQTRGSPFHYRSHFKNDRTLNRWCTLLERTTVAPSEE